MKMKSFVVGLLQAYGTHVQHPRKWWVHERLQALFGVKLQGTVQVTRRALRFELNLADYLDAQVYWFGEFDRWTLLHARRLLRPGSVVIDVGANIGYHSIWLARALGPQCRVVAFEPGATTFARLTKNIALNGLESIVSSHQVGLSDQSGTGYMVEEEGYSNCSFVSSLPVGGPIVLSTLDSVCAGMERIEFVKIDVEGFEEKVLQGAAGILERVHPILCLELNPTTLHRQNSSVNNLVTILEGHGYRLFEIERNRLVPLRRLPVEGEYGNVFGLPRSGSVRTGQTTR